MNVCIIYLTGRLGNYKKGLLFTRGNPLLPNWGLFVKMCSW